MSARMTGRDRTGTSLVEVLIATFILTIMALGTTAYVYHAAARIGLERNRRVALEVATGRLEALRAAPYTDIAPATKNFSNYFLAARAGGGWNSNPSENVAINGRAYRIVTIVRYMDLDGSPSSYDCVRIIVSVRYRPGSNEQIELATYIAP